MHFETHSKNCMNMYEMIERTHITDPYTKISARNWTCWLSVKGCWNIDVELFESGSFAVEIKPAVAGEVKDKLFLAFSFGTDFLLGLRSAFPLTPVWAVKPLVFWGLWGTSCNFVASRWLLLESRIYKKVQYNMLQFCMMWCDKESDGIWITTIKA